MFAVLSLLLACTGTEEAVTEAPEAEAPEAEAPETKSDETKSDETDTKDVKGKVKAVPVKIESAE